VSIWDFETDETFQPVVDALSTLVKSNPVNNVFVTKQTWFGTNYSLEQLDDGSVHTWEHFQTALPKQLVSNSKKSVPALMSELRDARNVFQRSLEEITPDAVDVVLDLIAEKSLYKGDEWQSVLTQFNKLQIKYYNLPLDERDNYCWVTQVGSAISRIRNHSIGVLLQDISKDVDVIEAVKRYENIVAPHNYKRPKAIFTKRMVEQAQTTIEELGLLNSLGRRHATLGDVTINNVLFVDRDAAKHMNGVGGVFDVLKQEVAVNVKQFERVQGISIEKFLENVSNTTKLEVLFENRHIPNLVSLIAPKENGPTLFKWNNSFSWAYNGNVTDSMKQRVKAAGGNVEGVIRFSLQWNENGDNENDFDAHCVEPNGNRIWYSNKHGHYSSGDLDVDIINPRGATAVENITWSDINRMQEGVYEFLVHNYSHRGGRNGFSAEIEHNGQIWEYEYREDIPQNTYVTVAKLSFNKRNGIKFIKSLPSSTSSKEIWKLQTNQFQPVSFMCYSPNYWDEQHGIGHKHYMVMLTGCINEDMPNGFFNEYLREEFMEHKRVFAALGDKMKVEPTEDQLSGLGFSSTKRNSLICKVDGKAVKIIF
jgi:hypothetical protein